MSNKQTYDKLSDADKFREQYRFVFAGAIVATAFAVNPDSNILWQFWVYVLYVSAFLAALYLISSAAHVKYKEPGRMYEAIPISERFRRWTFDWSVNVFGAAFVFFLALILTGLVYNLFGVKADNLSWLVTLIFAVATGFTFIIVEHLMGSRDRKNKQNLII